MSILLQTGPCTDYVLGYVFSIVKDVLSFLQIIAPIVLIIGLSISITKLVSSGGENKKHIKGILLQVLAIVFFFALPWLVGTILDLFVINDLDKSGAVYTLGSCYKNAEELRKQINSAKNQGVGGGTPSTNLNPNFTLPNQTNPNNNTNSTLIFVGDSRTVGMQSAVGGNDIWSCKTSQGYSWMKSTGVPNIESKITNNAKVIILLGVNDLGNINSYISYVNQKANDWKQKGASTYFISVLPTDKGSNGLNTTINSFNQKLKNNLNSNVTYMDVNSYLKSDGFTTTDGLHYTNDTYQKIYNYIKSHL